MAGMLKEILPGDVVRFTPFNAPEAVVVAVCTNLTRPPANTVPMGGSVWNTDDRAYNYSDGNGNWVDSGGTLT